MDGSSPEIGNWHYTIIIFWIELTQFLFSSIFQPLTPFDYFINEMRTISGNIFENNLI